MKVRGEENKDGITKKEKKIRASIIILVILAAAYISFLFADIYPLRYWRDIWIETAMSTMRHRWLATRFIPGFIIDDVMSKKIGALDDIAGLSYKPFGKTSPLNDVAHQNDFKVGDKDSVGNRIIVNDPEQKIMISRAEIYGTVALILQVNDPSRVFLGCTTDKNRRGLVIVDMIKAHGAVAGINASGFEEAPIISEGGEALGLSMSEGEEWGEYHDGLDSICFTKNNRLIAGKIKDWKAYKVRDGCQFKPVIIADGKKRIKDTGGYGVHPRTCIAQRADGSVIMFTCEGRFGASLGMSLENVADILLQYGADIAVACDGGASTIMAYKDKLTMRTESGDRVNGRNLPNAFLIKKIKK